MRASVSLPFLLLLTFACEGRSAEREPCSADRVGESNADVGVPTTRPVHPHPADEIRRCMLDVADLASEAWSHASIVDVRSAADRSQAWVFGEVTSASIDRLAGMLDMSGKPLVMIGSGRNDRDLAVECAVLAQRTGHRVAVLKGGLREWFLSGRRVAGDTASFVKPVEATASEMARSLHAEGVSRVVLADATFAANGSSFATVALVRREQERTDAFVRRIAASPLAQAAVQFPLVVAGATTVEAGAWKDAFRAAGLREPHFYYGSADDFAVHEKTVAEVAKVRGRPPPTRCEMS